ncbi:hypothetical protein [Legionella brunensis]|uniref:hypothetical protein n=1 Tax=Legionella brunensis TaxID=29422 RepID=UPI001041A2C9|nr:hypothetical protein [Legionella brunensis]
MTRWGFALLSTGGHYSSGDRIDIPLFPFVSREYTYHGSFWGNYNDLGEIMTLASKGNIKHKINIIALRKSMNTLTC